MVFCFNPASTLLIILFAITILQQFNCEICCTPNVRTALFSSDDLDDETCWTTDNASLLLSRYLLQTILPKHLPKNIDSLSTFIDLCFGEVNSLVFDNRAHRLMVKSMSDTLGAYQQGYGLPLTYELYYEGGKDARLETVLKIISEQHEMQKILGTNGASWVEPLVVHDVVSQVESLQIECDTGVNYCEKIEWGKNNSPKNIPLPIVDDVDRPRALAFPLKDKKLQSLFSCSSENVLLTYYKTALCCLRPGCSDDIEYFQEKFKFWLKRFVVSHLNDGTFYPAYKGVLRVVKSVNNKNIEVAIMKIEGNTVLTKFKKVLFSKKFIKLMKNVAIGVAIVVVVTAVYPGLKFLVKNLYERWRTRRKNRTRENMDKVEEGRKSTGSRGSREINEHLRKMDEELRESDKSTAASLATESRKLSSYDSMKELRGSTIEGRNINFLNAIRKSVRNDKTKPGNSDLDSSDVRSESVTDGKYVSTSSDKSRERQSSYLESISQNSSNPSSVIIDGRSSSKNALNPEHPVKSSGGAAEPNPQSQNLSDLREETAGNHRKHKNSLDIYEMYRRMTNRTKNPDAKKRLTSHLKQRLSSINPRKRSAGKSELEPKDSLQIYEEMKIRMDEMLKTLDNRESRRESSIESKRKSRNSLEIYDDLRRRMIELSIEMKRRRTETERESDIDPRESTIDPRESTIVQRGSKIDPRVSRTDPRWLSNIPQDSIINSPKSNINTRVSSIDSRHSSEVLDPDRDIAGQKSRRVSIQDEPLYAVESPIVPSEDFEDIHLRPSSDDKSLINFKSFDDGYDGGDSGDDDDDDNDDEQQITKTDNNNNVDGRPNNVDNKSIDAKNPGANNFVGRGVNSNNKDESNKVGYFY